MTQNEKLTKLRAQMRAHDLQAYIIPGTDSHQSEYIAEHFQVRHWISGFHGSAGTVVVTTDQAGLWTDFRYYLEAEQALAGTEMELFRSGEPGVPTYSQWLAQTLPRESAVGIDGRLFSMSAVRQLTETLNPAGLSLRLVGDLVGEVWPDRPPLPQGIAFLVPDDVTGESTREKLGRLRRALADHNATYHLISSLDDIAWLLNLRGSDIPYNPLPLCYAMVTRERVQLFIDPRKLEEVDRHQLRQNGVEIASYESIRGYIETLPEGTRLFIDPNKTNEAIHRAIPRGVDTVEEDNPTTLMKACKNETELDGIRQAMVQDGIALVKFWYWLENSVNAEEITEAGAGERLRAFRAEQPEFRGESFHPIVGYKGNGAIIHYAAKPESSAVLQATGTVLVDSGGHYTHGTTDVTRVMPLGDVERDLCTDYTHVLKAHLSLAMLRFPARTSGHQLDAIARSELWRQGLNYGHGTGHGVGFFLNVHEGPQRLSSSPNTVGLRRGMVVSNEPGHYRPNRWGIRLENLVAVRSAALPSRHRPDSAPAASSDAGEEFFEFETLTLCPIDTSLIEVDLLTNAERRWLNAYHERVYRAVAPHVSAEIRAWLLRKTEQI